MIRIDPRVLAGGLVAALVFGFAVGYVLSSVL